MEIALMGTQIQEASPSVKDSPKVRQVPYGRCVIAAAGSLLRGEFVTPHEVKYVLGSLSPIETAGLSVSQIISGFYEYKQRLSGAKIHEAIAMYRITLGMEIPEGVYAFARKAVENGASSMTNAISTLVNKVSENEIIVSAIHGDEGARNIIRNKIGLNTPYGMAVDSLSTAHDYKGSIIDRMPSIEISNLNIDQLIQRLERMLSMLGLNPEELRRLMLLLMQQLKSLNTTELSDIQRTGLNVLLQRFNLQSIPIRFDE